jgi:hypothetical protein
VGVDHVSGVGAVASRSTGVSDGGVSLALPLPPLSVAAVAVASQNPASARWDTGQQCMLPADTTALQGAADTDANAATAIVYGNTAAAILAHPTLVPHLQMHPRPRESNCVNLGGQSDAESTAFPDASNPQEQGCDIGTVPQLSLEQRLLQGLNELVVACWAQHESNRPSAVAVHDTLQRLLHEALEAASLPVRAGGESL